MEILFNCLW